MKYIFILFFSFHIFSLQAQDSLAIKRPWLKSSAVPVSLITLGLAINNSQFEMNFQQDIRAKVGTDFQFKIDDYFQYVPIGEMYLSDAMGVAAKNHWFDQTKYLFIANLITSAITHGLKRTTLKTRPDLSSNHSFPSGHTSFAFTNASVLRHEFKDSSPILAYSGYFFATTTGAFRVINNRHWVSDVLVGAGLGILVTELVYYWEPLKNFNPFKKHENVSLLPMMNQQSKGFYFSYTF